MRQSDFHSSDRRLEGWIAPLEPVERWVREHPDRVHRSSRAEQFAKVWRRLAYLRFWKHGDTFDDETGEVVWLALSLRDLREAPEFPRMYLEAEWEIVAELVDGDAPVNGEALYDQKPTDAPILHYQFHGLPPAQSPVDLEYLFDVMLLGDGGQTVDGIRHAGAAGILASGDRPAHEDAVLLSHHLNVLRVSRGLEPLAVGEGRQARGLIDKGLFGLLIELENGETITPPESERILPA
jgi:hypothetical protein